MYDLVPDETQLAIVDAAKSVAQAQGEDSWATILESGLIGLGLPEDLGGADAGACGEILALTELGAAMTPPRIVAAMLAVHLVRRDGGSGPELDDVLAGDTAVGLMEPWSWSHERPVPEVWRRWPVSGEAWTVAVSPHGIDLVRVPETAEVRCLDPRVALGRSHGVPTSEVAADRDLLGRALTWVAALQTGLARQVLDIAVEYAKVREQFGKPIGSFQAVKHHLATMAVHLEAAQATVAHSAVLIDADRPDLEAARTAKVVATEAARENTRLAMQVHGGIGVTAESDLHLYLRRAHLLDQLLGSADFQGEALIQGVTTHRPASSATEPPAVPVEEGV